MSPGCEHGERTGTPIACLTRRITDTWKFLLFHAIRTRKETPLEMESGLATLGHSVMGPQERSPGARMTAKSFKLAWTQVDLPGDHGVVAGINRSWSRESPIGRIAIVTVIISVISPRPAFPIQKTA